MSSSHFFAIKEISTKQIETENLINLTFCILLKHAQLSQSEDQKKNGLHEKKLNELRASKNRKPHDNENN